MASRARRLTPPEGWPTLVLLAALVYANLRTVEAAGWGPRIELAPPLGLAGVLLGLLGAKSRLRTPWGLLLGLTIGFELLVIAFAGSGPSGSWRGQIEWLFGTLGRWAQTVAREGATHEPIVFAAAVAAVGYLIAFCSSWLVFRLQNGWWPLVINASIGLVHLSYASVDSIPPYLASVFLGVLMVASLELHLRRSSWQAAGVPVERASPVWALVCAAIVGGLALFVANQLPSGEVNGELAGRYQAATEPWRDFQRQVDRLFGGARGQARPGSGLVFSDSLAPRGDFELGSEPLLAVRAPVRRYWRTNTYDRYDGRAMTSTVATQRRYDGGASLPPDPQAGRARLRVDQEVTILSPGAGALFAADDPLSFGVPATVDARGAAWDVAAVRPTTPLQRGQSYTVTSAVAVATAAQLAEAPRDYPEWLDRYRELPVGLPARVGELANQLTTEARNPYERALAIEDYLRAMTYSTHTPVPPESRDWVDYFLFDSRIGYCDYFSTAMTVLLRTQGIPARVASGFASGTYDPQQGAWLVRESDAHSWVEAYFPGYGWVPFEPSAIRQPPERGPGVQTDSRASSAASAGGPGPDDGADSPDAEVVDGPASGRAASGPTAIGLGLGALGALSLLLGGLAALGALAWDRGLRDEPSPRRRYAQLRRLLRWGGWRVEPSATPYELAEQLAVSHPELAEPVRALARRHVEATYAGRFDAAAGAEAEAAWQRLRPALVRLVLRRRFGIPARLTVARASRTMPDV